MSHAVCLSVCIYALSSCAKIAEPIEKQEMTEDLLVQDMLYYMRVQIVLREGAIPGTTAGLLRKEVSLPLRRQFNANILYYYYYYYYFCHYTHLTASFPGQPGYAGTRKVKPV